MIISFTRHMVKLLCFLLSYEGIQRERKRERKKEKRLFVSKVWCKLASRLNLLHKRGLFAKIAKAEREKQKQNFVLFKIEVEESSQWWKLQKYILYI